MDGAELVERSLGKCLDLVFLAYVCGNTHRSVAIGPETSNRCLEPSDVYVCQHDIHACVGERTGHAQAHPASCSGYYRCLAVYVVHVADLRYWCVARHKEGLERVLMKADCLFFEDGRRQRSPGKNWSK